MGRAPEARVLEKHTLFGEWNRGIIYNIVESEKRCLNLYALPTGEWSGIGYIEMGRVADASFIVDECKVYYFKRQLPEITHISW